MEKYLEKINEIMIKASFTEDRKEQLINGLNENPDLAEELWYYLDNNDFLCKTKVENLSIVDILVWQIDHFRAHLDRDTTLTKRTPDCMALLAVETMIKMKKDPQKIKDAFEGETGTDQ